MLNHDQLLALQLARINHRHRRRMRWIERRHRLLLLSLSAGTIVVLALPELITWISRGD